MAAQPVSLTVAFLAGLLSFVSPCVLPLIPTYLTYLAGRGEPGRTETTQGARSRRILLHGLLFVLGFSLVFIGLGLSASVLGHWLRAWQVVIRPLAGLVVILFGIAQLGVFRMGILERQWRLGVPTTAGFGGSFLIGMAFSLGWTPCIGPVLSAILLLSSTQGGAFAGAILLTFYSLGLAVPFLLTATFANRLVPWLRRMGSGYRLVEWASGALLILIGLMIYTNTFTRLASLFYWGI